MKWGRRGGENALIERDSAVGQMERAFSEALAGRGSLILVEGGPGLGKSSLLEVAASQAREGGLVVLTTAGTEVQRADAYGTLTDLLRPVVEKADGRIFDGAAKLALPLFRSTETGAGSAASRFHGLFWTLSNLTEQAPLALVIDDAHWTDISSLRFFNYLSGHLAEIPVALVIALRPGEPDLPFEEVARLRSHPSAVGIPLQPLTAKGCLALLRKVGFTDVHPSAGPVIAEVTHGNPLLLMNLVERIDRSRSMDEEAVRDLARELPTGSLGDLKLRGKMLSDEQVAVARALAVLGNGATAERAAVVARMELLDVRRAIEKLVDMGLANDDPVLNFSHPLVRASFYEDLEASQRSVLHARAARLFQEEGARPSSVAAHLLLTEPQEESWVSAALVTAAREARTNGAYDLAARYLARALKEPMSEEQRAETLLGAAVAEASSGGRRVGTYLEEATRILGRSERLAAGYRDVGRHLLGNRRHVEAAAVFEAAVQLCDPGSDLRHEMEGLYLTTARLDPARRASVIAEIRRRTEEDSFPAGPAGRLPTIEGALMTIRDCEPYERAVALLERAIPAPFETLDESALTMMVPTLIHALSWCDMFEEAEAMSERSMDDARKYGSVTLWASAGAFGALGLYMQGRIKEAEALGRQALDALPFGWEVAVPFSSTITAYAAMERGDLDGAEEVLRITEGRSWEGSTQWPFFLEARGRLKALRGDLPGALADVREAGRSMIETIGTNNPAMLGWRSRLARVHAALGNRLVASDLVDEEIEWARRFGAPRSLATSLRVSAQVRGEIEPLEEAIGLIKDSSAKMERAFTFLAYGKALTEKGYVKEARPLLLEAQMVGETTGAMLLEREARDALRSAGAKPRRPMTTGVASLTPGELRVARFAARGYSNREIAESLFVTLKAVEWHLVNVYRKLGISSRKDLAAALGQGSSLDQP